jgi:hypothetical protein
MFAHNAKQVMCFLPERKILSEVRKFLSLERDFLSISLLERNFLP